MTIAIHHGDCREIIPALGVTVDAVVTDPPYHLVAIAERSKYPVKYGKDGAMQRLLGGFMNQSWDGGDIAFRPETWATIGSVLRPGGFLVAFGGTRTHHRLACAIEDAGFVIQDTLMWLFATGFPKHKHSTQAKHRNRKVDHGPLFEPRPLTLEEDAADSLASYNDAMRAIGERVKAGAPVPEFMLSRKVAP